MPFNTYTFVVFFLAEKLPLGNIYSPGGAPHGAPGKSEALSDSDDGQQ